MLDVLKIILSKLEINITPGALNILVAIYDVFPRSFFESLLGLLAKRIKTHRLIVIDEKDVREVEISSASGAEDGRIHSVVDHHHLLGGDSEKPCYLPFGVLGHGYNVARPPNAHLIEPEPDPLPQRLGIEVVAEAGEIMNGDDERDFEMQGMPSEMLIGQVKGGSCGIEGAHEGERFGEFEIAFGFPYPHGEPRGELPAVPIKPALLPCYEKRQLHLSPDRFTFCWNS